MTAMLAPYTNKTLTRVWTSAGRPVPYSNQRKSTLALLRENLDGRRACRHRADGYNRLLKSHRAGLEGASEVFHLPLSSNQAGLNHTEIVFELAGN